jgi:hypothetical protein
LPRRPTRPTVETSPAWPFGSLAWAVFQGPAPTVDEQLYQLDAHSYAGLIAGLLRMLPPPLRRLAYRRLLVFLAEYQRIGPQVPPEQGEIRAFLHMAGDFEHAGCHPEILRHHKRMVLDDLAHLPPVGRNRAIRFRALRERLSPLLKRLATVACTCQRQRLHPPDLHRLGKWPVSLGSLTHEVLAWHHQKAVTTMRDLLTRAGRTGRPGAADMERRLRRLFRERVRGARPAP